MNNVDRNVNFRIVEGETYPIDKIVTDLKKGVTHAKIVQKYDVGLNKIARIAKENGIHKFPLRPKKVKSGKGVRKNPNDSMYNIYIHLGRYTIRKMVDGKNRYFKSFKISKEGLDDAIEFRNCLIECKWDLEKATEMFERGLIK